jgi:hypothetical protein
MFDDGDADELVVTTTTFTQAYSRTGGAIFSVDLVLCAGILSWGRERAYCVHNTGQGLILEPAESEMVGRRNDGG